MEVTCRRSSDRNFSLAKPDRNLIVGEVRLEFVQCENSLEDDPLGKFGFMKDLVEGRPVMDFGWHWGVFGRHRRRLVVVGIQLLEPDRRRSLSNIQPLWRFGRSLILVEG